MNILRYEDIVIGAVYEFERTITKENVLEFAELTGDHNPLHVDPQFGEKSQFGKNIVHGMLAGSLFSTLVGMHCPGTHALYMGQTIQFKRPIFFGDSVTVRGTVIEKSESIRMIKLKTEIIKSGEVIITGEATTKIL